MSSSEKTTKHPAAGHAAPQAAQPLPTDPVATLHDDGCFTWKRDEFRRMFDRERVGWRMDVYAAPQAAQQSVAEKLLHDAVRHAEWHDKHIHPCNSETFQTWALTIYLPVPLSESDKSPAAALRRAIERAHGIGT